MTERQTAISFVAYQVTMAAQRVVQQDRKDVFDQVLRNVFEYYKQNFNYLKDMRYKFKNDIFAMAVGEIQPDARIVYHQFTNDLTKEIESEMKFG